jgi:hypothetical protein
MEISLKNQHRLLDPADITANNYIQIITKNNFYINDTQPITEYCTSFKVRYIVKYNMFMFGVLFQTGTNDSCKCEDTYANIGIHPAGQTLG